MPPTATYHTLFNLVDIQVTKFLVLFSVDNIFSNVISKDIVSGNITATISDHLLQFLISPNTFADPPTKSNVFERNWSSFDQENFVLDYIGIDFPNILKLDEKNVNSAANNFLDSINPVLKKKVNKYKLRFKKKLGLLLLFKNQFISK